MMNHTNRNSQR